MDAKVTDDLRAWAMTSVRATLLKNLEGPEEHFQHYSKFLQWHKAIGASSFNAFSVIFSRLPFLIMQSPTITGW